MWRRTFASLGRLRQISAVIARHGLDHYLEKRRSRVDVASEDSRVDLPSSARRFRAILEELGPTFIKFGQILSTRADLLPAGFAETLSQLQDQCPSMPKEITRQTIEKGLGKNIAELFLEFDDTPIASASIAQVHRAKTLDGHEVAVKVQRPDIQQQIMRDLDLLAFLAQLVEAIVEESGLIMPGGIVDEFEEALLDELDFTKEAHRMQRFFNNLDNSPRPYIVPKIYDSLTCRTVLTMEFIRGSRLLNLTNTHDPKKIAANIITGAFEQLFTDGLFHADPHPGNIFVLEDNRLALLDYGSTGQISHAMRETLVVLVVSIGMRDADTVARLLYRVGIPDGRVSLHRLRDACASLFERYMHDRTTFASVDAAVLLRELFQLAARFRIRIPAEYALIGRAAVTLEGIIRKLDPNLEVINHARPFINRLLQEQISLPEFGDSAMRGILRARSFARELPLTASQILMDLEAGKLRLQIDNPKFENIARNIDALGVTIFMGLVASGLISGSLFLLARYDFEWHGMPVVPTVGLYLASILFGGALGRYLLSPRLKKVSLARLFARRRRW